MTASTHRAEPLKRLLKIDEGMIAGVARVLKPPGPVFGGIKREACELPVEQVDLFFFIAK